MNKKILIVDIVLFVVGTIVSYFAQLELVQILAYLLQMYSAGSALYEIWQTKKPQSKSWVMILSLILLGLAAFLAGMFRLITADDAKQLVTLVFAVILFIAGLLTQVIEKKIISKEVEKNCPLNY